MYLSTKEDDAALIATLDATTDAQDLGRRLEYELRILRATVQAAHRVSRLRRRDAARLREHEQAVRNQIARVRKVGEP